MFVHRLIIAFRHFAPNFLLLFQGKSQYMCIRCTVVMVMVMHTVSCIREIDRALNTLCAPNKNDSDAVDTRQEMDLRYVHDVGDGDDGTV